MTEHLGGDEAVERTNREAAEDEERRYKTWLKRVLGRTALEEEQ